MTARQWTVALFLIGITIGSGLFASAQQPAARAVSVAKAYFAGGCFWCMEEAFEKVDGVLEVVSGYMGGTVKNPTVCQSIQFRVTQMYEQVKTDLPRGTTPGGERAGEGATTQRPTAGRPTGGSGGATFSEAAPPVAPAGRVSSSSSSSASGSAVDVPRSNAPGVQPSRAREASGGDIVVTGNAGCQMQIGAGAALGEMGIQVCHPIELVDESYARAGFYDHGKQDA